MVELEFCLGLSEVKVGVFYYKRYVFFEKVKLTFLESCFFKYGVGKVLGFDCKVVW